MSEKAPHPRAHQVNIIKENEVSPANDSIYGEESAGGNKETLEYLREYEKALRFSLKYLEHEPHKRELLEAKLSEVLEKIKSMTNKDETAEKK